MSTIIVSAIALECDLCDAVGPLVTDFEKGDGERSGRHVQDWQVKQSVDKAGWKTQAGKHVCTKCLEGLVKR